MLKPIWTYGVELWGLASTSSIEILERFQSKVLRIITDAPWYVPNAVIKRDLKVLSARQGERNYSVTYRQRLDDHPNSLLTHLLTPWSRVLLEKLTGSAASQEIPRIFGTRRFITVPTSARHLFLS